MARFVLAIVIAASLAACAAEVKGPSAEVKFPVFGHPSHFFQLDALQANEAATDAGIAQTWAFAHPDNKRTTGPLPRFAQMIRSPQYQMLLNHRSHEVREVSRTDEEAVFAVTVTTAAGEVVGYRWTVAKVRDGEHAGAWMTIAVSPPVPVGQAI